MAGDESLWTRDMSELARDKAGELSLRDILLLYMSMLIGEAVVLRKSSNTLTRSSVGDSRTRRILKYPPQKCNILSKQYFIILD